MEPVTKEKIYIKYRGEYIPWRGYFWADLDEYEIVDNIDAEPIWNY